MRLSKFLGGSFKVQPECQEGVRPPGDCPVGGEGCCRCQGIAKEGVVKHIAGEDAVIGCFDIEVELGRKHRAGKAARMVLPVPQQDVWVLGGLNQLEEFG